MPLGDNPSTMVRRRHVDAATKSVKLRTETVHAPEASAGHSAPKPGGAGTFVESPLGISLALAQAGMIRNRPASGFTLLETMLVVALIGVIAVIAVPMTGNQLSYLRLSGDARNISNAMMLAKMRAAATFTQSRLYVDLSAKTFRIETWQRSAVPPDVTARN